MSEDPDVLRQFTAEEADSYPLQICPECGQQTLRYAFVRLTDWSLMPDIYIRGQGICEDPACPRHTH
jgi:hypothetical protein